MKNVRKKIVKIHHIYKSQKSVVFYQYEKIQQTSNEMIKNVKTIQIHNSLHIKKKRQNKRIKQTKRLYEKQKHDKSQHFQNKRRRIVIN